MSKRAIQLARLDLTDMSMVTPVVAGTLGGRISSVRLAVPPNVRSFGQRIEWIPFNQETSAQWWDFGSSATFLLDEFLKLSYTDDSNQIEDFVKVYGVLGLGGTGLPACGLSDRLSMPPQTVDSWHGCAVSWEPIIAYSYYAAGLKALILMAQALKDPHQSLEDFPDDIFGSSKLPTDALKSHDEWKQIAEVWQLGHNLTWEEWWEQKNGSENLKNFLVLHSGQVAANFRRNSEQFRNVPPNEYRKIMQRKLSYWFSSYWIQRSGLQPSLQWIAPRPELVLSVGESLNQENTLWPANSMYRVLVAQAAAFICADTHGTHCSNCGTYFTSPRRPRLDQNRYCEPCRASAPSRRTARWRGNQKPFPPSEE